MTPAARHQAAIEILDRILAGGPAEQALTHWARASRFAGSKDRAAVRDLVFDAIRCKRSFAHLGGAATGRGIILGGLRAAGLDPATIFTGTGHAPAPLSEAEAHHRPIPMIDAVALDCPDWLLPHLKVALGPQVAPVLQALRQRAPVFLRVNTTRITRDDAIAELQREGLGTRPHSLAPTALEVTTNPRAIRTSRAYQDGLVELQDAASQAMIAALPDLKDAHVLDYCAGGGGKSLALAAEGAQVTAHDAAPDRMRDLPRRAARARACIATSGTPKGLFDLVLTDVPCSGSGTWRRSPEAKWMLTEDRLRALTDLQARILREAACHVAPGGWLAYVTCSLLDEENRAQVDAFLTAGPDFCLHNELRLTPMDGGDGFYLALMQRR